MKCFIIDDDIDDQEIFALAVQGLGKSVELRSANDCTEALDIFKDDENFVPDFIFLDLNMPGLNGKECLPKIKKLPWLAKVPIIIYTTSSAQKDRTETLNLGAADFLTKESSISQLRNSLTALIRKYGI
jgi:CheY-like chemotaxis protein